MHDPVCNTQESFRKRSFYPTGPSQQEAGASSQSAARIQDSCGSWMYYTPSRIHIYIFLKTLWTNEEAIWATERKGGTKRLSWGQHEETENQNAPGIQHLIQTKHRKMYILVPHQTPYSQATESIPPEYFAAKSGLIKLSISHLLPLKSCSFRKLPQSRINQYVKLLVYTHSQL